MNTDTAPVGDWCCGSPKEIGANHPRAEQACAYHHTTKVGSEEVERHLRERKEAREILHGSD